MEAYILKHEGNILKFYKSINLEYKFNFESIFIKLRNIPISVEEYVINVEKYLLNVENMY